MTQKGREVNSKIWYNEFATTINRKKRKLLMSILTQETKKMQTIVESAKKNVKSDGTRKYSVSLSSVKRWCKRYDGTWQ